MLSATLVHRPLTFTLRINLILILIFIFIIIIIIPMDESKSILSFLTIDDETLICYRMCLNLYCYMSKKVHESFPMGLKVR